MRDDSWRRVTRHALVLLGGGAVSALFALGTVSVTAHALPPAVFGALVMAQAYALLVERAGTFQSWQTLIRFGAVARANQDHAAFAGLIRFGYQLDLIGGVVGAALGVAVAAIAGELFGWTAATRGIALWYAASVVLRLSGTSLAILRLHDRFDQTAMTRALSGLAKLVASVVAAWQGAGLQTFAIIWMVADILPAIIMFGCARVALQANRTPARALSSTEVRRRYPELISMFWTTNMHSTVKIVARDADVLIAGAVAGPAVAGLVRIARQVGSAMGQLSDPLVQAIYPEMSQAIAAGRTTTVRSLVLRAARWGTSIGVIVVLVLFLAAPFLLRALAGEAYVIAAPALILYAVAQALALATLAVSPALLALGGARQSFAALCIATIVYGLTLLPAIRAYGASGAAGALILFQLAWAALAIRALTRLTSTRRPVPIDVDAQNSLLASTSLDTRVA